MEATKIINMRTLVFLVETDCGLGEDELWPHTVKALREYADALETSKGHKEVGCLAMEEWKTSDGKSVLRIVHGKDLSF